MTVERSYELRPVTSEYAPFNPEGGLPPGLRPTLLKEAYRNAGHSFEPLIRRLSGGHGSPVDSVAKRLFACLDHPEGRSRAMELKKADLHETLYQLAKRTSQQTYRRMIKPAEYLDGSDRTFLNVKLFGQILQEREPPIENEIVFRSAEEALAVFGLAFGLLQPADGPEIVIALASYHPAYAQFFGLVEGGGSVQSSVDTDPRATKEDGNAALVHEVEEPAPSNAASGDSTLTAAIVEIDMERASPLAGLERAYAAKDWSLVGELSNELKRLDAREHAEISRLETGHGVDLPRRSKDGEFEAWIVSISSILTNALRRADDKLAHRREALIRSCKEVGVVPPTAIGNANSESLERIEKSLGPQLRVSKALARAKAQGLAQDATAGLSEIERLELYGRILSLDDESVRSQILPHLLRDTQSLEVDRTRGAELVLDGIVDAVESLKPLPAGTWDTLALLVGDEAIVMARERGALSVLSDVTDFDVAGLVKLADGNFDHFPPDVALALRLRDAAMLDGEQRVQALARALADTGSNAAARQLLAALLEQGRHAEALYLAYLGERAGWLLEWARGERSALWRVLVENASDDSRLDIVDEILSTATQLVEDEEEVLCALYIIRRLASIDQYHALQFGPARTVLDSARDSYPSLVKVLQGDFEVPDAAVEHLGDASRLSSLRATIESLEHDLLKRSCYSSWEGAEQYQRSFVEELQAAYGRVQQGEDPGLKDADEMIQNAMVQRDLFPAKGNALNRMRRYLNENTGRLTKLRSAFKDGLTIEMIRADGAGSDEAWPAGSLIALVAEKAFGE